jgi:Domain of unknown function (DUF929)
MIEQDGAHSARSEEPMAKHRDKQAERERQRALQRQAEVTRRRSHQKQHWTRLAGGGVAVIAMVAAVAFALHGYGKAGTTRAVAASLGAPTSAVPSSPLGSFTKAGPIVRQDGKTQLLFVGALYCPHCAVERWAVIKALSQFGTFSHVQSTTNGSGVPTFDLTSSQYTSRYVAFDHKDIEDQSYKQLQTLSPDENATFQRLDPSGGIPLVSVGGYAMSGSPIDPGELSGQAFDTIQHALKRGSSLAATTDINAEANVLTGLICHADGMKPGTACNRPAIRHIVSAIR